MYLYSVNIFGNNNIRLESMRGSGKFCQRGSKFDNFFLVDEGIEHPNTAINGPSLARQRNAI